MPDLPELPPLTDAPISLILLARNDADHLHDVVLAWQAALKTLNRPFEVIVADDGSTDGTPMLAGSLEGVRLVGVTVSRGQGAALRAGLAAATNPVVVTVTCDRQYQPDDLAALLKELDPRHLVTGFRVWQPVPGPLKVLGWIGRTFIKVALSFTVEPLSGWLGWREWWLWLGCRLVFGLRVHDVRCPFRVYRREIFRHIPIQSDTWFAQVEVLAKANFLSSIMSEVAVKHVPRPEPADQKPGRATAWQEFNRLFDKPDFG